MTLRFPWENPDGGTQPPPLECQWCGADLAQRPHLIACRVVAEIDDLGVPGFLDRRPPGWREEALRRLDELANPTFTGIDRTPSHFWRTNR